MSENVSEGRADAQNNMSDNPYYGEMRDGAEETMLKVVDDPYYGELLT